MDNLLNEIMANAQNYMEQVSKKEGWKYEELEQLLINVQLGVAECILEEECINTDILTDDEKTQKIEEICERKYELKNKKKWWRKKEDKKHLISKRIKEYEKWRKIHIKDKDEYNAAQLEIIIEGLKEALYLLK